MKKPAVAPSLSARRSGRQPKQDDSLINNKYLHGMYRAPTGVMRPADKIPLTEECKHYSSYDKMPEELQKQVLFVIPGSLHKPHLSWSNEQTRYWHQRNTLWQYDNYDIRMTDDAWFGVTPEPIAVEIATEMAAKHAGREHKPSVLIDLFAGAGGNTIQFALSGEWDRVIAVERDAATLACAQHNAEVYEVAEYVTFVHADCFDFLNRLFNRPDTLDDALNVRLGLGGGGGGESAAATLARVVEVFASPPWGGVGYQQADVFDLEAMEPYSLAHISSSCRPMAHALFLPRNGDLRQLASLVPDGAAEKMDVVQYCVKGAAKGLVAYFPPENEGHTHGRVG